MSKHVKNIIDIVKKGIDRNAQRRTPSYPVINEAKSYAGAFKVARLGDIVSSPEKCLINEGVDWVVDIDPKGGVVVFSTDVNDVELPPNRVANWVTANETGLTGWTIGHYLEGRYRAKNGRNFGGKSLCLELVGIDDNKLVSVAENICGAFAQECVLVKSYSSSQILFVNPERL